MEQQRVLTFGLSASNINGQDMYLMNMNKTMSKVKFDYVVVGDKCIHEDIIKHDGSSIQYVSSYTEHPMRYIFDVISLFRNNDKIYRIAYFNLFSMVHLMPVIIASILGYKVILHSHNSDIKRYKILHVINRFIFGSKKNWLRLSCSEKAAMFMYGKAGAESARIINNAVDVGRFVFSNENRLKIKEEYGITNKIVFGFVGRLEDQKNPLFLMQIFQQISKRVSKSTFLIIGEGSLQSQCMQKAKEYGINNITYFVGSKRNIEEYYSAIDVLILPSKYEGLPIVLIEAQSAGLISIVSKEAVPEKAMVKDNFIRFVSLECNASEWAERAIHASLLKIDRIEWNNTIKQSRYNIENEAKLLEEIFWEVGSHS